MSKVLTFPAKAVHKPRPVADRVEVQFDLGRWCVALMVGLQLSERRMYFVGHAECVENAKQIAAERGLPFNEPKPSEAADD
jgi:hypothetical protein